MVDQLFLEFYKASQLGLQRSLKIIKNIALKLRSLFKQVCFYFELIKL